MVHNWAFSDTWSPAAAFNVSIWGTDWRGATLNGVDNVGSVEESKYSACLHTNETKKWQEFTVRTVTYCIVSQRR